MTTQASSIQSIWFFDVLCVHVYQRAKTGLKEKNTHLGRLTAMASKRNVEKHINIKELPLVESRRGPSGRLWAIARELVGLAPRHWTDT